MSVATSDLSKAIFGDEDTEVIKSGTMAVTRGAGVLGAGFVAAANLTPFGDQLTAWQKVVFGMVVGIGWVLLAAADCLARAYATAHAKPDLQMFNPPIPARVPAKRADDEAGWSAYLMRVSADSAIDYFVVKGTETAWVKQEAIEFGVKHGR